MEGTSPHRWTKRLLAAVGEIDRPGTFCTSGVAAAVLPGLEVEGMGSIGLPLSSDQANQLRQRCEQAAYGKGEQTVVDTSVRRVWRLTPERFTLANPAWPAVVHEIVGNVRRELGLGDQALQPHLYDLLLYEEGGFFLPHRDGEKLDRMVATLVVVLPSVYSGGELIVRHEDQEQVIDFAGPGAPFQTQYAAFYADCEHEVKPLTGGYRLCLVYNLTLLKSKPHTGAPRHRQHFQKIADLLAEWSANDGDPRKIALALDHQYTQDGLAWDALKGVDRARARVLSDAAMKAGCHAYLALLTLWESGSAEDDGGYSSRRRRRRWGRDEEENENAAEHEMGEIFDSSLTADHWRRVDGAPAPLGTLPIEEDEVFPEGSLTDVQPEENVEGYTGNEGMTLERWYRRAAILVWPDSRHFEILCSGGAKQAMAMLSEMIAATRKATGKQATTLKERCRLLAERILDIWPQGNDRYRAWRRSESADARDPLSALEYLDDPELIRIYLRDTLLRDSTIEPGAALVKVLARHGWRAFRPDLAALFLRTDGESLGRNVRLLDRLCRAASRAAGKTEATEARLTCRQLAEAAVAALVQFDAGSPERHWQARDDVIVMLVGLVGALSAIESEDLLSRVVTHVATLPDRYPLRDVQAPALLKIGESTREHRHERSAALSGWIGDCERQLKSLTAAAPQPPSDFRREAKVKCDCADCSELNQYLADPAEGRHSFKMAQHRRDHLESLIRRFGADVDCTTDRRSRPQILICTKNTATHDRLVKEYHQNLKLLANLRSIQSND